MNSMTNSEAFYGNGCRMIKEIIDSGHTPEEIAMELAVSPASVCNWYFHISSRFKRADTFEMISILHQIVMEERLPNASVRWTTVKSDHNKAVQNSNTSIHK